MIELFKQALAYNHRRPFLIAITDVITPNVPIVFCLAGFTTNMMNRIESRAFWVKLRIVDASTPRVRILS